MYKIMRLNRPDKKHLFIDLWDEVKNAGAEIKLCFTCQNQCRLAEIMLSQYPDLIPDFKVIQTIYEYCLQFDLTGDNIKPLPSH